MLTLKLFYMNQNESFPFYIQTGKHDDNVEPHTHEDFSELVIVTDGSATHIVGNERFRIKKNDVFVIGEGLSHSYENTESFRIINIMFRPAQLIFGDNDLKKSRGFHSLFIVEPSLSGHSFKSRLSLTSEDCILVRELTDKMLFEYDGDSECRETLIMAYFTTLVVMLSRIYERRGSADDDNIFSLAVAAAYMENHYSEPIELSKLSELSHYSLRHFIRLFGSTYGITPQKYLSEIRYRHARLFLLETDLSVSEIASRCGFPGSNYFSTAFKKEHGTSPADYRKSAKK